METIYLIQKAYHLNLTTPKHVWVLMGGLDGEWWQLDGLDMTVGNVNCTQSQINQAVDGYFSSNGLPVYNKPIKTVSGLVNQFFH